MDNFKEEFRKRLNERKNKNYGNQKNATVFRKLQSGKFLCLICEIEVRAAVWSNHEKSEGHRNKLNYNSEKIMKNIKTSTDKDFSTNKSSHVVVEKLPGDFFDDVPAKKVPKLSDDGKTAIETSNSIKGAVIAKKSILKKKRDDEWERFQSEISKLEDDLPTSKNVVAPTLSQTAEFDKRSDNVANKYEENNSKPPPQGLSENLQETDENISNFEVMQIFKEVEHMKDSINKLNDLKSRLNPLVNEDLSSNADDKINDKNIISSTDTDSSDIDEMDFGTNWRSKSLF